MISIKCLEDCNADIVYLESNRTQFKCWNCNRVWGKRDLKSSKEGITVLSGPGLTQYSPIREEEPTDGKVLEQRS